MLPNWYCQSTFREMTREAKTGCEDVNDCLNNVVLQASVEGVVPQNEVIPAPSYKEGINQTGKQAGF